MSMKLSSANPYLRNPAVRESMVIKSVVTSSAIEGIRALFKGATRADRTMAVRKRRLNRKKK
jgi:hypothetical protein